MEVSPSQRRFRVIVGGHATEIQAIAAADTVVKQTGTFDIVQSLVKA